ncbi:hypothetical protein WH50_02165 [Pokkaliibacter plantistimulans]|uniref:Uncharacterized protein n=1 Tax=Pokkaliibacter plantistimulans TaxID=1635171 RepID=A0ABX5M5C9_9GAMM|nr:hypothetical protein [Pokkaliibacter plantistimulans]PXF32856.1 hypothetical protein WH50_02165 [Pokkaliibacter plantistimulans]
MNIRRLRLLQLCIATILVISNLAHASPLPWSNLRAVQLYIFPAAATTLQIDWRAAWLADANQDRLFVLDAQGQLLDEQTLDAGNANGSHTTSLTGQGPYQVVIPGYSFRNFRLAAPQSAILLQPSKVHFSLTAEQRNSELYFQTKAGEQAILGGKYQDKGISAYSLRRLSDGKQLQLPLSQTLQRGFQYDRLPLPVSQQREVWQLTLNGTGKAAFWLDGTANLFAQSPGDLRDVNFATGQVSLTLGTHANGKTPKLGFYDFNASQLPRAMLQSLAALKPRFLGAYSFYDALNRDPFRQDDNMQTLQRMGMEDSVTLLAGTGMNGAQRGRLDATDDVKRGLAAWLNMRIRLQNGGLHYISFADEPNNVYPDYASYERYFRQMAQFVRSYPGAYEAGVRIAAPASANFVNTPFSDGAAQRKGIDWARQLLADNPGLVDAVAWHEWDHSKDLLATRWYRHSVQQAAQLVGSHPDGSARLPLYIDQTNIGSGNSTSPYQQDTFYADLWWTSVVINSAMDGKLSGLAWFLTVDDDNHHKGIVGFDNGQFTLRPVARAMAFINRFWKPITLPLQNSAFEVDAMAMTDNRSISILAVNKAARMQHVTLPSKSLCANTSLNLTILTVEGETSGHFVCRQGQLSFTVPPQSLFALHWNNAP